MALTAEEVKDAVRQGVHEAVGSLYIDREKHFKHHAFIDELIELMNKTKNFTWFTILGIVITSVIGLIIGGLILWGKQNIR